MIEFFPEIKQLKIHTHSGLTTASTTGISNKLQNNNHHNDKHHYQNHQQQQQQHHHNPTHSSGSGSGSGVSAGSSNAGQLSHGSHYHHTGK